MLDRVHKAWSTWRKKATRHEERTHGEGAQDGHGARRAAGGPRRTPNLFEAAAAYVTACVEDDQERVDEAAGWVEPNALAFGVNELACRALIALARERDESPRVVARSLLGLPVA
ncbi:hypothetical protein [Streptomyces sp. VRA16 Mangrove soil]|uniref:hypothetical protein n=1 Tax=Streptomyces sp. VRA16 Mangrove soil TaxID=2817434 RepID=UPI001A9E216D|nr:hypothetical protein [Streptomyces sp. VRA16 Mangrove soil]MBO1332356.1 hypothetical protein [Streptomyces sp. VRA16 Mangrove soil]